MKSLDKLHVLSEADKNNQMKESIHESKKKNLLALIESVGNKNHLV